jgi:hypothetical protein
MKCGLRVVRSEHAVPLEIMRRRRCRVLNVILRSSPNPSLGLFRKNSAQHKHCWRSASAQPPSEGAVILRSSWAALSAALFSYSKLSHNPFNER